MTAVDTDKLRLMATLQQWVHEPFVTDAANEIDALHKRLEAADNAMRQALSDFEWIERMVPGSNLQASILLLRHALAHNKEGR